MTVENDFLAFAAGPGANVLAQSDYAALAAVSSGFQAGTAQSAAVNKVWRQASIMSAVLAQLIVDETGQPAIDDGTTTTLLANLKSAFQGRLLTVNMFATHGNVNFIPATPNSSIYMRAMGAGAAGGSTPATGANQYAIASGGSTGAYAEGFYQLASATPIPITIGAGGFTVPGAAGGNGGTTSVGSLITCPGGVGGSTSGLQSTSIPWTTGTSLAPVATGGNICNSQGWAGTFGMAIQVSAGTAGLVAGGGGPSPLGNSIAATQGPPGTGGIAGILGGGGRGAAQGPLSPLVGGGNGGDGWVMIFEFGSR
ncbi:hypothetical protein ACFSHT_24065 [Paraburkholderia silviterrae]|uniref:hypothetical protein n=1 Tax=Paraburkholderia silviterrae TaxID=2528715 RepID=UPI001F10D8A7|nr:hypothetical protein [Paraburkholderia silviterrae]